MRLVAVALAAALLVPAAAARAQPVSSLSGPGPDTYLELHAGAFLPQQEDIDALDPGYAFGGTFGARFSPNVSVEGGVGYLRATGEQSGVNLTLSDVPITASVRLRFPFKVAELAAIGGVGLHVASLSSKVGTDTVSDTSTAFGFHLGAAAAVNLSPTMLVGLDVRRTFVQPRFSGVRTGIDGIAAALTLTYHL